MIGKTSGAPKMSDKLGWLAVKVNLMFACALALGYIEAGAAWRIWLQVMFWFSACFFVVGVVALFAAAISHSPAGSPLPQSPDTPEK
jgi:hypothetical protein